MDHLGHKPGLRMGVAHPRKNLGPERLGYRVGRVQSPSIDTAAEPMGHHIHDVIHHRRGAVVEGDQIAVAFEVPELSGPAGEPGCGIGIVIVDRRPVPREIGTDVVEDPVE